MAREPGAVGSSLLCPLSQREPSPAEQLARAWALAATGDRATFSHVWTVPRTAYQQAIALLVPENGPASPIHRDAEDLRRAVSIRMGSSMRSRVTFQKHAHISEPMRPKRMRCC
jgi:hypothetical protein